VLRGDFRLTTTPCNGRMSRESVEKRVTANPNRGIYFFEIMTPKLREKRLQDCTNIMSMYVGLRINM
jgi:hypothetical protein